MKAPKLLKNESAASFRTRVAMWEKRTGKKYPKSGWGTPEERALSNRIKLGDFGQSNQLDYSKDYDLDDIAKEEVLAGSYTKYKDTEEGKKFARQELAIQEAVEQDKKEDFAYKASKGQLLSLPQTNYVQTPSSTGKGETDEKGGLPISETVTINKKNPAAKSEYPEGDAVIPIGKKYPTTIGGKKTSPIQKKLLDAGHDPKRLRDLMKIYKDRYKSKRGW